MRPPARPRRAASLGTSRPVPPGRAAPARPAGAAAARPATPARPSRQTSVDAAPPAAGAEVEVRPEAEVAGWTPVRPSVVSARSAERFAERARMRRTLLRRRVLGSAAGALVAGALAWLLLLSPVLALDVERLTVTGDGGVVDPADVVDVVAAYDGVPLPRLDTVGLRRELLQVPGVRGAEVGRDWPDGLRVVLAAREPVAAVPLAEGGVALLDRDGVRVGHADATPEELPLVQVPVDGDARALTAVLTVLEQLPDELGAQVSGISARSRDTVTVVLADGQQVEWGSADQTALKAEVLMTLRSTGAAAGAAVVDVSAPTLPITRS